MILVGDPAQIGSVGPGGMLRYLTMLGRTAPLTTLARFTESWEGLATLRLRDADPTVVAEYAQRQRILSGDRITLTARLLDRWTNGTLAGRSALLLTNTEADAAVLAAQARLRLIEAGLLTDGPAVTLADTTQAGMGDRIFTRRNNRALRFGGAQFVTNRDQWIVRAVRPDGSLAVVHASSGHPITLAASYVSAHVQLAYAATVDSAQGRTVDVGLALIDSATSRERLYVMATRGAHHNILAVITPDDPPEAHPAAPATSGVTILANILRADTTQRTATETEQTLWADVDSLYHWGPIHDDLTAQAKTSHYTALLAAFNPARAADLETNTDLLPLITRLDTLARAGYDAEAILKSVVSRRELDTADDIAAVLSWRIDQLRAGLRPDPLAAEPAVSYSRRTTGIHGDLGQTLRDVAALCDRRIAGLTDLVAVQHPDWATSLGPVPDDPIGRRQWRTRTAAVVTHRDRYRYDGPDPLGPEPDEQDPDKWRSWHRARTSLGVATLAGKIAAANPAQLATLIEAQQAAEATAPEYIGMQLRSAHLALIVSEDDLYAAKRAYATAQQTGTALPPGVRDAVRLQLATATRAAAATRATVTALEARHRDWTTWYRANSPVRYAGLAAAAETARRTDDQTRSALTAVKRTAARLQAVHATFPQSYRRSAVNHLPQTAAAAYWRVTPRHDGDPGAIEEPGID